MLDRVLPRGPNKYSFCFSPTYTGMERMEQQRANDMSEIDQKLKDNFNKMEELTDILRKLAKNK